MAEVLRCPFCGSKAKIDKPSGMAPGWQVFCTKCEAVATSVFGSEAEAIAAWNKRVEGKYILFDYIHLVSQKNGSTKAASRLKW